MATGGLSTHLARADDAVERRDWAAAAEAARQAIDASPGHPDALAVLRMAERRMAADPVEGTPEPQRQQLSVMFCDVVGSTNIANHIEIEAYRELLIDYQTVCGTIISHYEGHIARFIGDGLLVYFGYPATHEDDPRRAVLAGLAMTAAMEEAADDYQRRFGVDFRIRVGIHTGEVIVSDMGAGRWTVTSDIIGPTANFAARLEGQAPANGVAVSNVTASLVDGYVELSSLGTPPMKGFDEPLEVFEAVRPLPSSNRIDAAARLSAFVGRNAERALLEDSFEKVKLGESLAVHIVGEAGIGKSRLLHWMRTSIAFGVSDHIEGRCSPYSVGQPFQAFSSLLGDLVGIDSLSDPVRKQKALLFALGDEAGGPIGAAPFLASLVDVTLEDHPLPAVSAEQLRELTMGALVDWVSWRGSQGPTVLAVEDLHWADASSLEALERLAAAAPPHVLILTTSRTEESGPSSASRMTLTELVKEDCTELVRTMSGANAVDTSTVDGIVERSGGVPFFLEELVRAVVGGESLRSVPSSLRDLLTARLNALGPERSLVQLIATLADEVPSTVLRSLTSDLYDGISEEDLDAQLAVLIEAGLLIDVRRSGSRSYSFRHALQRDAAYDMQILTRRVELHNAIADLLPEVAPAFAEQRPALLAHHCEQANRLFDAVGHHTRAGQQAASTAANIEAIVHFNNAIRLVDAVDPGPATDAAELAARVGAALAVAISQGYTAPGLEEHWDRANALVDALGKPPETIPARWGGWAYRLLRGQIDHAHDLALDIVESAAIGDESDRSLAATLIGEQYIYMGRYDEAIEQSRLGTDFDDMEVAVRVAQHPALAALSNVGTVTMLCGDIDRGLAIAEEAAAKAAETPFPLGPVTQAFIHHRIAWAALPCGLADLSMSHAAACYQISAQHGYAVWLAHGGAQMAATQAVSDPAAAIPGLEATFDGFMAVGAPLGVSNYVAALAGAHLKVGDHDAAVAVAQRGLDLGEETGDVVFVPDLLRIWSEAHLGLGDESRAIDGLRRSIDVASSHQHRVFQLRGALALASIDTDEIGQVRSVISHFPSTASTPDLERARGLVSP